MKNTIFALTMFTAMAMTAQSTSSTTGTSPNSNPTTSNTTTSTAATDQSGSTPSSPSSSTSSTVTTQETQQTTPTPGTQSTSPSNPNAAPDISGQSSTMPKTPSTAGSISGTDTAATPDQKAPETIPSPDQGTSAKASAATGQTYEGCIRERRGKYSLVTADGKRYHLTSTQDLSAHKGHEVRVTGDTSETSAGVANSEPMSENPGTTGTGKSVSHSAKMLNVTNVEMVSTTCAMKGHKGHKVSGDSKSMNNGTTDTNPK